MITPALPTPRARHGFTLMEMLVTVLVLVVVAGAVLPMMGNSDASRLRSAAGLVAADLNYAQVESLSHGDDLRLVVFTPPDRYHVAAATDPDTPLINPATRTPYAVTFGDIRTRPLAGVTIKSVTAPQSNRISFGLYGQLTPATTTPATVTLVCGSSQTTLSVDPTTGEVTRGDIVPRKP